MLQALGLQEAETVQAPLDAPGDHATSVTG
jgi:hypothetical protein